jgi:DNA-binding FadR family transcriptional regulator
VAALRAGDEDAAAAAMADHVDDVGRFWRRTYGDLVARPVRWVR